MNKKRLEIFNKSGGRCWYCGADLNGKRWHEDHFEPLRRGWNEPFQGPDTQENKVPACAPCNLFKSIFTVDEFRREIESQVERARKSSVNFRTAERFGCVQANDNPVVFWFERNGLNK